MSDERDWKEQREESVFEGLAAKLKRMFRPKTDNQAIYLQALESKTITICTGPAGTGKTYMACGYAARMLKAGLIEKIIITRPLVPCGKGYGFRPGDVAAKIKPDMRPFLDAFHEFFGPADMRRMLEDETIEMLPLDDMRGCSLPNTIIICDEAQNAELNQLHMLLTRFGEGSKVIVTGDIAGTQTDLRHHGENPLLQVIKRFAPKCHIDVQIVRLGREDIVRHPLIQWIDERFTEGPPEPEPVSTSTICPECDSTIWFERDTVDQCVICHRCEEEIWVT